MLDLTRYIEVPLLNGNTQYFRTVDGISFEVALKLKDGTIEDYTNTVSDKLIDTIVNCYHKQNRLRVWYGDTKTGRSWLEEFDVTGAVGRSCGNCKIPLLIHSKRSYGGGALLVGAIIRIDDIESKQTLWKVDNFHVEDMRIDYNENNYSSYPYMVMQKKDGETEYIHNVANFKTEKQAWNWVNFMNGKRYCK